MKNQLSKLLGFKAKGEGLDNSRKNGNNLEELDCPIENDKKRDIKCISVEEIEPNPYQPRVEFNEDELRELANSIEKHGIIQPLTVKKKVEEKGYELIAGERRLRASKLINLEKVPAIIREFEEKEMAEIALIENLQRKDLNFLEEAVGYKKLLEVFSLTQKELADQIGKSQSTIANKLRLLKLSDEIQELVKDPNVTERHTRALLKLPNKKLRKSVIEEVIKNGYTVREMEAFIEQILKELNNEEDTEEEKGSVVKYFEDVRLSLNTIRKTIKDIEESGLDVEVEEIDEDEYIEVKIRLPKK
ncbi:nucleoid occlusion protein [Selenihalanaerobacter shriftii]|uniref:Chromosome partitioning protein, ParB family n=1 Tax=Selenihalanaerobacter shriftii TaxID=142842 RepID=A0A1T4NLT2_9FIRM|nr:nucleoid occlusion protein [Selenihalanaerobacter shriftii]SJZ80047.1 chromosome partitioning protein, ParB family [Selenihalanaerobacter shriftii]